MKSNRSTTAAAATSLLALAGLASSLTLPCHDDKGSSSPQSVQARQAGDFVTTDGTLFNIDGTSKYYAGSNSYWISMLMSDADVATALDDFAASGLKILRVWGFADVTSVPGEGTVWFQHLSSSGSTINESGANGLPRLDAVVRGAEERGIKLIVNFVNFWDDYGGMAAYQSAFGLAAKEDWYTSEAAQAQYRAYAEAVVGRYKDSAAILAWELANEPRCNGCETSVVTEWARGASAFVKGLDPDHLVTLGDEGFGLASGDGSYPYQFGEGIDFAANLEIESLDFGTLHLYPSHWGVSYDWANAWIENHAAACLAAGKPCLLEEYGAPENHCALERPWQLTSVAAEGMAGDLFWQYGTELSSGPTHDDTFTIYVGDADWQCLVTEHVEAIG